MSEFTQFYLKRLQSFFLIILLLLSIPSERALAQHEDGYSFRYPRDFFNPGGTETGFNPTVHKRIGILIRNHTNLPLQEITTMIFNTSPFDRYKQFFYFRIEEEFREDITNNNILSTRAYDYSGRPITGGLSTSGGQGAFNLIFLKFGFKEVIRCSCNGVTIHTNQGNFSFVGEDSILHEIGHSFVDLADEYSHPRASDFAAINLEDRNALRPKWNGLIEQGFLPDRRIERREVIGGVDKGRFLIPSNNCFMNNHTSPKDNRYCPVCQLAIISRISQLSGAVLP